MTTDLVPLTITNDVLNTAYHELLDARAKQRELSQASASVVHAIAQRLWRRSCGGSLTRSSAASCTPSTRSSV